ncbi:MAG: group 1 truncated hemoglobin [Betaproteobacteria bacterium]
MNFLLKITGCLAISFALAAPAYAEQSPLMAQFGGVEKLQKMTDEFVELLLVDPRTRGRFSGADIPKLKILLGQQFCQLIDNSCTYTGKDMKSAHSGMGLRNTDFNALAEDLQIVLEKNGVPFAAQNKLVAKLASMQRDVVTK